MIGDEDLDLCVDALVAALEEDGPETGAGPRR
jgi:hypothetical protein